MIVTIFDDDFSDVHDSPKYRNVTIQARYVGTGVQPLIDAVKAAGSNPNDLRALVWQATWARGYEDVVSPTPTARLRQEGFLIFARAITAERYAAIIDTGHALWALVARGPLPKVGSRVRAVPAIVEGEIGWDVAIIEELGLGLTVRFGARAKETHEWAALMHAGLARITEAEAERRRQIVIERRTLVAIEPIKPFKDEVDALYEQLRTRIEAEAAATPEERAAFEKGNEKQRKAIIDGCKARRVERYEEELALLRARLPEMQATFDKRVAANNALRDAVTELEDAASRSRGVTERIATIENQLTAVQTSSLIVSGDLTRLQSLGPNDSTEISQTVELLYDLMPRRSTKR